MENLLFNSWESLLRTALISLGAYGGLVFLLRSMRNRTLSQLNAFDFVVTIALGSTLATVMLNKSVSLADGILAFGMLVLLQFVVNWFAIRSTKVRKVIKTAPSLVFYRGEFLDDSMQRNRITRDEILQIVRSKGVGDLSKVDAIVFENNGKFSVIQQLKEREEESTLRNVQRPKSKRFQHRRKPE